MMKPSLPKGTRDFLPAVVSKRNYIMTTIRHIFERYGYQPIETPALEQLDTLLGKYGEEGDRLIFKILNNGLSDEKNREKAKEAFEHLLTGKNDRRLTERALRYDLTIPFARFVVQHQHELVFPFRRYQIQPVWRADRPQKGRYREFWQCDADVVGSASLLNEAELMAIYRNAFHDLGLPGIVLRINHRKILAALAECCHATDALTEITIAIDKLDKIGLAGVEKALSAGSLSTGQVAFIMGYLKIEGNFDEKISRMRHYLKDNKTATEGLETLRQIVSLHAAIASDEWKSSVSLDFTLARGLNYYTGFIVEVAVTGGVMGSIGGGGRYDDLTGLFGVKGLTGVGISFGIDRIYDVMETLDLFPHRLATNTQILFLNLDPEAEPMNINCIKTLREQGIAAEYYMEPGKLDKQLKYAHKRGIPFVAMIGPEERSAGAVTLKNMASGTQETVTPETLLAVMMKAAQHQIAKK